jgi:hypothetical protein
MSDPHSVNQFQGANKYWLPEIVCRWHGSVWMKQGFDNSFLLSRFYCAIIL